MFLHNSTTLRREFALLDQAQEGTEKDRTQQGGGQGTTPGREDERQQSGGTDEQTQFGGGAGDNNM